MPLLFPDDLDAPFVKGRVWRARCEECDDQRPALPVLADDLRELHRASHDLLRALRAEAVRLLLPFVSR